MKAPDDLFPEPDPHGCEYMAGWAFLNALTGETVPARCGRNRCAYCLRVNARRRARAIAWAGPERAILLTLVGDDWQTVRPRMYRLRYRIARAAGLCEWVWHVEPNPKGTGHHVHAWQHGAFVPQDVLSRLADEVGMGRFVRINRVRSRVGASAYGLKGLTYGLKGVEADDEGTAYLRVNGYRLTHQSRGYFRGLRVRDAERVASGIDEEAQWVLIRA